MSHVDDPVPDDLLLSSQTLESQKLLTNPKYPHYNPVQIVNNLVKEAQKSNSKRTSSHQSDFLSQKKTHKKAQSYYGWTPGVADLQSLESLYKDKVKFLESYNAQLASQLSYAKQQNYLIEMDYQQKLLDFQSKHYEIVDMMREKYHYVIQQLKGKLKKKQKDLEKMSQQITQHHDSGNILTNVSPVRQDDLIKYQGYITMTQPKISDITRIDMYSTPRDQNVTIDNKMLGLYQTEIERLKKETLNFEKHFNEERNLLKSEIQKIRGQREDLESGLKTERERALLADTKRKKLSMLLQQRSFSRCKQSR